MPLASRRRRRRRLRTSKTLASQDEIDVADNLRGAIASQGGLHHGGSLASNPHRFSSGAVFDDSRAGGFERLDELLEPLLVAEADQ
jgi:hypothetical protein